jgi:hypothetical protein
MKLISYVHNLPYNLEFSLKFDDNRNGSLEEIWDEIKKEGREFSPGIIYFVDF